MSRVCHAAELPEPGDGREQPSRLGVPGDMALQEERALVRVEPHRVEQRGQVERPVMQVLRVVVGRNGVQVDDAEERVVLLLGLDVLAHGADVVPYVFGTRGLDAGEDTHFAHLVKVVGYAVCSGRGGLAQSSAAQDCASPVGPRPTCAGGRGHARRIDEKRCLYTS